MSRRAASRPFITSALTVVVAVLCVVAVVTTFVVLVQRLAAADQLAAYRLTVVQEKEAQLADLLDKYTALADDCEQADDCVTTAPAPEIIERVIESTTGAPGEPGRPPTAGEISDAVRAYGSARDDCAGRAGADSTVPGPAGADSTVPGPSGADSTVPGPPGERGAPGADGRGVTDTQCVGEGNDSYWVTTYSDGAQTTSPGPCRLSGGITINP